MDILFENIEKQLTEIEILKSIYSNPKEFSIEDELALYEANEFLATKNLNLIPQHTLSFIIKFNVNCEDCVADDDEASKKILIEISCRLPLDYPLTSHPEVMVRCDKVNLNRKFYENLNKYISDTHENECFIMSIIDWIKDNLFKFVNAVDTTEQQSKAVSTSLMFSRTWVYFHHIYSTDKRQKLVCWAREFDLTGFVMPGKPGMLCIEGSDSNIQDYLARVRRLPWQKIQIKDTETCKCDNYDQFRRFNSFEEKVFVCENNASSYDLGSLNNFLKEKNFPHIFSMYFGVEGKSALNKTD